MRIGSGCFKPSRSEWQVFERKGVRSGIFADINTSSAGFIETPLYFLSLEGEAAHWMTTGANCVYFAKPKSFRVYIRWAHDEDLKPETATEHQWKINWFGIEAQQSSTSEIPTFEEQ